MRFGGADLRVADDMLLRALVVEADLDRAFAFDRCAVAIFLAVMVDDDQFSLLDDAAQQLVQKPHTGPSSENFRPPRGRSGQVPR
jgi:hypothetical protein